MMCKRDGKFWRIGKAARFRTRAPEHAAPSLKRPASETLHNYGLGVRTGEEQRVANDPIAVIRHAAHSITSSARVSAKAAPKVAILSRNLAAGSAFQGKEYLVDV
jgi:hypothetical protein